MSVLPGFAAILAPREGVNDDTVRVVRWHVAEAGRVEAGQAVATLETTKTTFELETPRAGFLFPLAAAGAEAPVGTTLALVADEPKRPDDGPAPCPPAGEQVVTKKALALIQEHGLAPEDYAGLPVVRASDVEDVLRRRDASRSASPVPTSRGAPPEETDGDAPLHSDLYGQLRGLLTDLRRRMKARFNRHVSTGDLLYDRWDLARDYGFGEATSVYDSCLILGDVRVGRFCWVGPHTILDGSQAPLRIGDHVDVGSGAHIYTHNTIERALTGHKARIFGNATTIGDCCFIGPMSIIAPGSVLGDHCFVAAASYVEGTFPSHSYIAGSPARRVGVVEIRGDRARLRRFETPGAGAS